MSSLFKQATAVSSDVIEATVQSVDIQRWVCSVKTIHGQRYNNVIWLSPTGGSGRSSASFAPKMGDRVKLSTGLGYPVIDGFLPRIDRDPTSPISIDTGSSPGDTGSLTSLSGMSFNSSKAGDQFAGDHIISSEGGGLMGVLRGGTVLMKASALAQIIVSKMDDCVKLVGRSTEIISEVGVEIFASVKGTAYKYVALAATPAEARSGLFRYQEFYGDTQTAQALKDGYEMGSAGGSVSPGGPLKKVLVVNSSGVPLRIEELNDLGDIVTTTQSADSSATNVVGYTKDGWSLTTTNGTFCNISTTKDTIVVNFNNDAVVTWNVTNILMKKGEDTSITMTNDFIETKKGTSVTTHTVDSILSSNGAGHFVNITPAGVLMG